MAIPHHRFGDFRLDLVNGCLWSREGRRQLAPKTFELLRYLVENPGRLLRKSELLDAVWPDQFVTEAVLKAQVARLRKALGDGARWVVTEPRRGYRFAAEVRRGSVPSLLSTFTGREQELDDLIEAIGRNRLVSLVGAGGCGKTRLASELARRLESFAEGPVWIELAGVADGELVATRVARVLGVREGEESDPLRSLRHAIGYRRLLLILDNCEHLLDACAQLAAALLGRCPRLHVVTTSRAALGVDGEVVRTVAPLPVPARENLDPGALLAVASVRLFADRLGALDSTAPVGPEEVRTIARICQRLEGLPLAIELAAARVPALGLEAVARRLEDAPRLLRSPGRGSPSRHRTLEAAIDWSIDLLDAEERRLFARLSVFRGGFDVARVAAICGLDADEEDEASDRLAALVERSLVVAEPRRSGMRYRLLEPIRQVAEAHLGRDPEEESATRTRHARWCLELASGLEPEMRGSGRLEALRTIDRELDNLRAAMGWTLAPAELGSVAARIASDLLWYWFHRGLWSEGQRSLAAGLEPGRERDPLRRTLAVEAAGRIDFFRGAYAEGFSLLGTASAELERLGDAARSAEAESFRALCALALEEVDRAHELALRAVERIRPLTEPWRLGILLVNLGNVERHQRAFDEAAARYAESISIFGEVRDDWALGMAYRNLGMVDAARGEVDRAIGHLQCSLGHLRKTGERWFVSRGLEELAANLVAREQYDEAARLFGAGEALREAVGAPLVPFYRSAYEAAVGSLRRGISEPRWQAEWEAGRAMTIEEALAFALALR
jgi:predicted ATPase